MCPFPYVTHGRLELRLVVALVLRTQGALGLVTDTYTPVASVRQGHVVHLEAELRCQAVGCRVLVSIEQCAELELGVLNLPRVGIEEQLHEALVFALQCCHLLVILEVLCCRQEPQSCVRPWHGASVVHVPSVGCELLHRIQFGAVAEELLVHVGHALVSVVACGHIL